MSEHSADYDAHAGRLRIWREAAEKGIESGIDWPMIARALFKELDSITEDRDMFRDLYYDGIKRDLPPPGGGHEYLGWRDGSCTCSCGRRFASVQDYEGHVFPSAKGDE